MTMRPGLRKFALAAHVTSSVGWLGAVTVSLVLGLVGVTSRDAQVVRAVHLALEPIGWYALVPFSFASLVTGLLQSLGTKWGLFRHYWVLAKLVMNVFATGVLLLYMQTLGYMAEVAAKATFTSADLEDLTNPSPIAHAGAALLLLLVAVALSIYKPTGMTQYGQREQRKHLTESTRRKGAFSQS